MKPLCGVGPGAEVRPGELTWSKLLSPGMYILGSSCCEDLIVNIPLVLEQMCHLTHVALEKRHRVPALPLPCWVTWENHLTNLHMSPNM